MVKAAIRANVNPKKTVKSKNIPSPCSAHRTVLATPVKRSGAERVSVDDAGRIVVPAKFRKALGIKGGQELTISMEGDGIKLRTLEAALEHARALAKRKRKGRGSVVDQFIAERRAHAAKE